MDNEPKHPKLHSELTLKKHYPNHGIICCGCGSFRWNTVTRQQRNECSSATCFIFLSKQRWSCLSGNLYGGFIFKSVCVSICLSFTNKQRQRKFGRSTLDTQLAVVALASSSAICSLITSTIRNSRMWYQQHSWDKSPLIQRSRQRITNQGRAEFFNRSPGMYSNRTMWNRHTPTNSLAWTRFPARGDIYDRDYYSTFHKTRNRMKFTKQEWADFSRESTQNAIADLAATPEFTNWMIEHADRIKILPCDGSEESVGSTSSSSDEEGSSSRFRLFPL